MKFWETKSLRELTGEEWEALCDRCGRCCLVKLEDEDTGSVHYTDVACRLLDVRSCCCTRYQDRTKLIEDCIDVRAEDPRALAWMPSTCAYRLVHEGKRLPDWHPLISGHADSVHRAGISVRDRCVSETEVGADDLRDRLIEWIETRR
jgi:uncharacterized cysteine cluster protein YcgN (CxxCxxCC family)